MPITSVHPYPVGLLIIIIKKQKTDFIRQKLGQSTNTTHTLCKASKKKIQIKDLHIGKELFSGCVLAKHYKTNATDLGQKNADVKILILHNQTHYACATQ
jgi:hypothetical protein